MAQDMNGNPVRVVLTGGPETLPATSRTQVVTSLSERIKVPYRGGLEHFELDTEGTNGISGDVVFRWTMRTKPAE